MTYIKHGKGTGKETKIYPGKMKMNMICPLRTS